MSAIDDLEKRVAALEKLLQERPPPRCTQGDHTWGHWETYRNTRFWNDWRQRRQCRLCGFAEDRYLR